MDTLQQFKDELTYEYQVTKNFFNEYPEDKNDYKPHPKSMGMMHLAQHITDVFGWPGYMLKTETLDMADGGKPKLFTTRAELLEKFEENYQASMSALKSATEKDLEQMWSLANKGQKLAEWTKYGAIRHSLNQITHHRAQLGVFYRLNDIKVPHSYGPTADDQTF